MSNLHPEKRVDKNGVLVTRYVKDSVDETKLPTTAAIPSRVDNSLYGVDGKRYPGDLSRDEVDEMVDGVIECALFTSITDDEEPLDGIFGISDITDDIRDDLESRVLAFVSENEDLVKEALDKPGYGLVNFGHDYWYTVNGHGTGFWDREELGQVGKDLADAARKENEIDMTSDGSTIYVN